MQEIPIGAIDTTGGRSLTQASNEFLQSALGIPHTTPNEVCQDTDNPALDDLLSVGQGAPFSAVLLAPATQSLARILDRVKIDNPDLHDRIGSAGGLCVRLVRGSGSLLSNHSWGTAIDLSIDGLLDAVGDGMVQLGLVELSKYFAAEGWIWGADFAREDSARFEDSAHFEVSQEKLQEWLDSGLLAPGFKGK